MKESHDKPHRSDLRKGRVSLVDQAYFITKCLGCPVLTLPECAEILIGSFMWARNNYWWRILGFIIMPNHYHLLVGLGETKSLSEAMYSVDRYTASRINRFLGRQGNLWEEGFYDHAIRDRRDFDDILDYFHNNPLEAGLIESMDAWPYSTANAKYADEIDWEWLGISTPNAIVARHRFDRDAIPMRYR